MKTIDHDKVARAYVAAWKRTRDFDTAYAAAEQTYRILHPETKDTAVIKCIVAIAIGGIIGEGYCVDDDAAQADYAKKSTTAA